VEHGDAHLRFAENGLVAARCSEVNARTRIIDRTHRGGHHDNGTDLSIDQNMSCETHP
jgi:hypothetical protein